MDPIDFKEVKPYLEENQMVYVISDNVAIYFLMSKEKIMVYSSNAHYSLSYDTFSSLFSKEQFYLYHEKEDGIDLAKDDAYYAWKSRNAN